MNVTLVVRKGGVPRSTQHTPPPPPPPAVSGASGGKKEKSGTTAGAGAAAMGGKLSLSLAQSLEPTLEGWLSAVSASADPLELAALLGQLRLA